MNSLLLIEVKYIALGLLLFCLHDGAVTECTHTVYVAAYTTMPVDTSTERPFMSTAAIVAVYSSPAAVVVANAGHVLAVVVEHGGEVNYTVLIASEPDWAEVVLALPVSSSFVTIS